MVSESKSTGEEFNLPQPGPESALSKPASEAIGIESDSEALSTIATEVGTSATASIGDPASISGVLPGLAAASLPTALPTLGGASPQLADDGDLIEKEWVEKAKRIVERTKDDPFVQSRELNLVKFDYLKKRYNKDIEVSH